MKVYINKLSASIALSFGLFVTHAFAENTEVEKYAVISNFGFSVKLPNNWEEYTPKKTKAVNFRYPWLKSDGGGLMMFGVTTTKFDDLELSDGAVKDAKTKTLERGGILFTGDSKVLTSERGVKVLRANFTHEGGELVRYYMKNDDGALRWINVYSKNERSFNRLEEAILESLKKE